MHLTAVDERGMIDLGDVARQLGYRQGQLVEVIVSSARGTLILALHDTPVTVEAQAKRLPQPRAALRLAREGMNDGRYGALPRRRGVARHAGDVEGAGAGVPGVK
jgi:hypothetical protein